MHIRDVLINFISISLSLIIYYLFFLSDTFLKNYYFGFIVTLLTFSLLYLARFRERYNFSINKTKLKSLIPLLTLMLLISLVFRVLFKPFDEFYSKYIFGMSSLYFLSFLILYTLNEEVLFRGLIQSSLSEINEMFSIFITSILFVYPHYKLFSALNLPFVIQASIYVFFVSLIISYSLCFSRSYVLPILLHFIYNYYSYLQLYLEFHFPNLEIMLWLFTFIFLVLLLILGFREELKKIVKKVSVFIRK